MVNVKTQTLSKNEIFDELLRKQIDNIDSDKKLQYNDLKRLCKYINTSIFDETKCCIWKGYVTNSNNPNKGTYINFYFRKKKSALHRLLYNNFVGKLTKDEYIKFNCENKGNCCNISHFRKYTYKKSNTMKKVDLTMNDDCSNKLTIIFD